MKEEHLFIGRVKISGKEIVVLTKDDRQPFVVVDVLIFGDDDSSSFLVESFVVPVGVDVCQNGGDSVVFSEEDDLQDGQLWVLVGTGVTCRAKSYD